MRTTQPGASRRAHRLQVRVDDRLLSDVRDCAGQTGQSLSSVIRQLVAKALRSDEDRTAPRESPAALAALVASELATLMVASVLPDGERRMHELEAQAVTSAQERLAGFVDAEP